MDGRIENGVFLNKASNIFDFTWLIVSQSSTLHWIFSSKSSCTMWSVWKEANS